MRRKAAGIVFILAVGAGMAGLSAGAGPDDALPDATGSAPQAAAPPYRCERDGRTTYQSQPCGPGDRQSMLGNGTFNVVTGSPPDAASVRPEAPPKERAVAAARIGGHTAAACTRHAQAIARIDARGRQGGRGSKMDRLAAARRRHQDEMWRLKCAF